MRLLYTANDGRISWTKDYISVKDIPPYAILSHTWQEEQEVTFDDLTNTDNVKVNCAKSKEGYEKIRFCAQQAKRDGLDYFWVDTCCINKDSSAELTEAINSMFRWYQDAERCYVYLPDITIGVADEVAELSQQLKESRWFTRGWTLQELIAPASVEFFSKDQQRLGDKRSLENILHGITGIAVQALRGRHLSNFSVNERMSWADRRETTRAEDAAYCLLGVFGIHMPLIYGEGQDRALNRLRKEITESMKDAVPQFEQNIATRGHSTSQCLPPQVSRRLVADGLQPASTASSPDSKIGQSTFSEEQRKEIMDSLHFKQRDARLLTLKSAQTKTCRWLLKNAHYKDWTNSDKLRQHHGFFWIKGKPGTGKSIMMKFLFSEAKKVMKDSLVLSFFFNARGGDLEKSTSGLYRALLLQLLEKAPETRGVFDHYGISGFQTIKDTGWQNETLRELFSQALQELENHRVVCFVDALDECPEDDVRDMVAFFEELGELETAAEFRVCFSSRHYPEISIRTGLQLVLESEQDHTNDITSYINTHLKVGRDTQAEDIKAEILHKSSGIFLWVSLVIPILNKEYDRGRIKALKKRLKEIPAGLHDLFLDMLTRDHKNMDDLIVCLQVVLFAARPLRPDEFCVAVETCCEDDVPSEGCDPTQMTSENLRKLVLDSSKGLAEITKSKEPTVQFIHESVRDFLLKEGGINQLLPATGNQEGQGHSTLKKICLLQLSLFQFGLDDVEICIEFGPSYHSNRIASLRQRYSDKKYPLLQYAVEFIFHHTNWAQKLGLNQIAFLERFDTNAWVQVRQALDTKDTKSFQSHLLYFLGETGSADLIRTHPNRDQHLEVQGGYFGVPLLAALFAGHSDAARAFVKLHPLPEDESTKGAQRSSRRNLALKKETFKKGRHVLSYLCEFGDTDILRTVLESGRLTMDSSIAKQCFLHATSEAVVDTLAKFGACTLVSNENQRDEHVFSSSSNVELPTCAALHHFQQGLEKHPDLIKNFVVLGPRRAVSDSTPNYERFLLNYAAIKGFEHIARLCVNVTHPADRQTALRSAVCGRINQVGRMSVIRCLHEARVPMDQRLSSDVRTRLRETILQPYNEDVVSLLLSTWSLNLENTTLLLWAIEQGRKAYVKIFVSAGSDPMATDIHGANALILAVKLSDLSSFRTILESPKCKPDGRDKNSRTALSWCATVADEYAITMVSDLLRREDVDPNSEDSAGQTVLMRAVQSGNPKLVEALLGWERIDPDFAPRGRSTPLKLAFKLFKEERHEVFWEISRLLLLTFRVDPESRRKLPTPAEFASEHRLIELLGLLIAFRRCCRIKEVNSFSAWDHALRYLRWPGTDCT